MVAGADHNPCEVNTLWPELPTPEPPCRVDKWGVAAGAKLLVIKEAYAVESEEDPNAKIQAYCSAQGLPLPEGEGLEPAIAAMEAAKEFLDESTLAMQEARMATLRPGIADTYTDTPAEGPSCLQARFESDKAVVLLSTPSFDGDPELALWTVACRGPAGCTRTT